MGPPLLKVSLVSLQYSRTSAHKKWNQPLVVKNVTLAIEKGETLGLLGLSGCGKTSLARAIAGLMPLNAGQIEFNGHDVATAKTRKAKLKPGQLTMIFQDAGGSLNPRMRIGRTIQEPLLARTEISKLQRTRLVGSLLERVGLSPLDAFRFPHELSGGQRQRIAIARALAADPQLIICDEPVSALDLSIQAQIIALLVELQKERGLSYLFITHNIDLARILSHRIAVMSAGQIVEQGDAKVVLNSPQHPATQELINSCQTLQFGQNPVVK